MALSGKIALVTGGSRGIGRAVVERLAADGAQVCFTYRQSDDLARDLAGRTGAIAVRADHGALDSVDTMFAALGDRLDILVNNAADASSRRIAELTADDFDRALTVNTKVPLFALRRAAALMPSGGRIVNISTLNTVLPAAGLALYCASKAALEQVTAVAARELGSRAITVNTVSPGATDTDLLHAGSSPEALVGTAAATALRRLGRPAEIAAVVGFLCSPDAGWITGQNIRATGGLLV